MTDRHEHICGSGMTATLVGGIFGFQNLNAMAGTTQTARQVYEPGGLLTDIRDRVKEFMGKHNEEFPAKKVTITSKGTCVPHASYASARTSIGYYIFLSI